MISAARPMRPLPGGALATPARIGRFVAPDRRSVRFVVENLYAAHSLRERLLWPVHRWTGGYWLAGSASHDTPEGIDDSSAIDRKLIAEVLRTVLPNGEPATSWIHEGDYPQSRRGRALLFVFAGLAPRPVAVIKCGTATMETPLGRERDVLLDLRARLPAQLASTVPEPIAYSTTSGREALALGWLRGRSAYAEMQTTLRPAGRIRGHLEAAATWLARFHDATARDAPGPLKPVTSHGDFWARNLLITRWSGKAEAAGIIDWEHCRDAAPPFDDLFHFAASYGLNYSWRRYRRLPFDAALRATFLERTGVSAEVRRCFLRYCGLRGIDFALVDPLFRLYVLERAQQDSPQRDSWCRVQETLARAARSVFSG